MEENIFNYSLSELEQETLNLPYSDETSYLLFTTPLEILCDLHLLFLMRRDKVNSDRVINMIKLFEEAPVEY